MVVTPRSRYRIDDDEIIPLIMGAHVAPGRELWTIPEDDGKGSNTDGPTKITHFCLFDHGPGIRPIITKISERI